MGSLQRSILGQPQNLPKGGFNRLQVRVAQAPYPALQTRFVHRTDVFDVTSPATAPVVLAAAAESTCSDYLLTTAAISRPSSITAIA